MSSESNNNYESGKRSGNRRAALIVAHPGHELRVHGWLEKARPFVCVLTDGSGRTGHSRIDSTTTILKAADCKNGPVYGVMTDQELYAAVLDFDHAPFIRLVDEITSLLVGERIEYVAGDAEEHYNPAHDICRIIINAAVQLTADKEKRPIRNFDFNLVGPPDEFTATQRVGAIRIELDEAAVARKLAAARNYPELQAEVSAALAGAGSVGFQQHPDLARQTGRAPAVTPTYDFAVEYLRPIDCNIASGSLFEVQRPFYELYGERQVLAGHYNRVLRYREHMRPLADAIHTHVARN